MSNSKTRRSAVTMMMVAGGLTAAVPLMARPALAQPCDSSRGSPQATVKRAACNPCAGKKGTKVGACNPCAAKKKKPQR